MKVWIIVQLWGLKNQVQRDRDRDRDRGTGDRDRRGQGQRDRTEGQGQRDRTEGQAGTEGQNMAYLCQLRGLLNAIRL